MYKPDPLPPDYAPPSYDNLGYEARSNSGAFPGPSEIMTPQQANDTTPPPAYDAIFHNRVEPIQKSSKNRDHRSLWDKSHELFENSILQQLLWLGGLAFAIFYIYKGTEYTGKCTTYLRNGKSVETEKEDLAGWMKIEGALMCTLIIVVFLLRILGLVDRRRENRIKRSEIEGRKKCGGAGKVLNVNRDDGENKTNTSFLRCDDTFYNFYYSAKIGQVVVFACYAAYVVLGLCVAVPISKKNFLRRKLIFFAHLLDADQDGVISLGDMKITYDKLEVIRKSMGNRQNEVNEFEQKELWNKHVFKRGPNKSITVDDYASYLEGMGDMHNNMKLFITGLFNAFSTAEFRKKNTILAYEDFARFWEILAGVEPRHCKKIFIRDFLNPITMASLLEDFVHFLSKEDFFDPDSTRVFLLLKPSYEVDPCFEEFCRPSCCNV